MALCIDRFLQDLWVGKGEVGWCYRIDELPGVEFGLAGSFIFHTVGFAHGVYYPLRRQQVGLLDVVEDRVFLPGRIRKTIIVLVGFDERFGFLTYHTVCCLLPQANMAIPKVHLRQCEAGGIGHHPSRYL